MGNCELEAWGECLTLPLKQPQTPEHTTVASEKKWRMILNAGPVMVHSNVGEYSGGLPEICKNTFYYFWIGFLVAYRYLQPYIGRIAGANPRRIRGEVGSENMG